MRKATSESCSNSYVQRRLATFPPPLLDLCERTCKNSENPIQFHFSRYCDVFSPFPKKAPLANIIIHHWHFSRALAHVPSLQKLVHDKWSPNKWSEHPSKFLFQQLPFDSDVSVVIVNIGILDADMFHSETRNFPSLLLHFQKVQLSSDRLQLVTVKPVKFRGV